jgi:PAS domain S-box-containing protein
MGSARRSSPNRSTESERVKKRNLDEHERLSLVHELSVYQDELVAQNDQLKRAQSALEDTRDQFVELYDFAPTVYLTLDPEGVVRQCNLTATAFFGRSRQTLHGLPLLSFIHRKSRAQYMDFLRRCRSGDGADVGVELTMRTSDGRREVHLVCRPRRNNQPEYLTSIIDITERKELERERERTAREHAALANRLLAGIDEERQRIARNLHDDVGQQLTAIRRMFGGAIRAAGPAAASRLRSVQQMIEGLDRRLHLVATELRPPALDVGLVTAVEQFVERWAATIGIPAAVHIRGVADAHVPPDTATHLYRIVQEALNNVAKHAAALHVSVQLDRRGSEIVLIVSDDGRGFDLEQKRAETSLLGLVGMRERAQLVGGQLRIQTAPTKGTSISVCVPARPL